jgi:hypothetical protein
MKGQKLPSLGDKTQMSMTSGFNAFKRERDKESMKINILSYLLDVGSVILGKGDTQTFKFYNPSKYTLR